MLEIFGILGVIVLFYFLERPSSNQKEIDKLKAEIEELLPYKQKVKADEFRKMCEEKEALRQAKIEERNEERNERRRILKEKIEREKEERRQLIINERRKRAGFPSLQFSE
jgi:phage-related minor tail protein